MIEEILDERFGKKISSKNVWIKNGNFWTHRVELLPDGSIEQKFYLDSAHSSILMKKEENSSIEDVKSLTDSEMLLKLREVEEVLMNFSKKGFDRYFFSLFENDPPEFYIFLGSGGSHIVSEGNIIKKDGKVISFLELQELSK